MSWLITLKDFSEKYKNIYSYSMLRKLFWEWKLQTADKVWNTTVIIEDKEKINLELIKKNAKPGRNKIN